MLLGHVVVVLWIQVLHISLSEEFSVLLPPLLADVSSHASSLSLAILSQMRAGGCKLQWYQLLDHTSPCETGFSDRLSPRLEFGAFRSHVGHHHSVGKYSNFKSRISASLLQSSVPNLTYDVIMSSELCLLESFQHFLLPGQLLRFQAACLLEANLKTVTRLGRLAQMHNACCTGSSYGLAIVTISQRSVGEDYNVWHATLWLST